MKIQIEDLVDLKIEEMFEILATTESLTVGDFSPTQTITLDNCKDTLVDLFTAYIAQNKGKTRDWGKKK